MHPFAAKRYELSGRSTQLPPYSRQVRKSLRTASHPSAGARRILAPVEILAITLGAGLVASVVLDLVNTLVATDTHSGRWWLTSIIYRYTWRFNRRIAKSLPNEHLKNRFLANYAPITLLLLLCAWVIQQVVGFGLIWWGVGGLDGATSLFDSIYYSGVVYFTLGFGEVVPADAVPRIGALAEAMAGVLTTALLIGYLPSLYGAYSERERMLMTLDDGSEDRVTPTNLVIARAPGGDTSQLMPFFKDWELWIASVLETHTAFPMLRLFRSKQVGQSWITALGLVSDAALHCQMIRGLDNREAYWCLRRSIRLFDELTTGLDLTQWYAEYDEAMAAAVAESGSADDPFQVIHTQLAAHGFDVLPLDEARAAVIDLRRRYAPALEFLIHEYVAPAGFWGHSVGHRMIDGSRSLIDDAMTREG